MKSLVRVVCGAIALMTVGLSGCASTGEPEFGSSVRHMVKGQIYNPAAPDATMGALDGAIAARAVEGYRAEKKGAAKASTSAVIVPTQ